VRYNGLQLVIHMALAKLAEPRLARFQDALVLGAIREDVVYLPHRRKLWEHWSLSHFDGRRLRGGFIPFLTAGAPRKAQTHFNLAVREWHAQRAAHAFVQLGRASHLLIDMACPVHAHRVPHWTDGYEWFVESHCEQLAALPVEVAGPYPSAKSTVAALARFTRQFAPDRTHHHWGRWLQSMGWRQGVRAADCAEQARRIVPVAAGHLAALYLLFLQATQASAP
jgi:hypothetical protein